MKADPRRPSGVAGGPESDAQMESPRVPLVRVYSHVRSGANWLMALLQANYYRYQHRLRAVKDEAEFEFRSYGGKTSAYSPWGGLHAGHTFSPPRKSKLTSSIYLFRDGRSVIASLYDLVDHPVPFSDYLRSPLGWYEFITNDRPGPYLLTPVEHWYLSTRSWLQSQIMQIRYEDLLQDPAHQLKRIEQGMGLQAPRRRKLYKSRIVGFVRPGTPRHRNTLDRWKQYFKPHDLEYFFSIVPEDYECLNERLSQEEPD